jgi:hypothetical protein
LSPLQEYASIYLIISIQYYIDWWGEKFGTLGFYFLNVAQMMQFGLMSTFMFQFFQKNMYVSSVKWCNLVTCQHLCFNLILLEKKKIELYLYYHVLYFPVPVSLAQLVWTMHKNMQGPGFKPRPPPKKMYYIFLWITRNGVNNIK